MKKLMILTVLMSAVIPVAAQGRSPMLELETPPCDFDHFLGQQIEEIMPEVKVTERPYRVVNEHGMMTHDYSPSRITIITQDDGTVIKVSCY